jgi:hypothetical protein
MESEEKNNENIKQITPEKNDLLDLEKIKSIINKIYKSNQNFNEIVENNLLIKKLSSNIDNFYNQYNVKNECNYYYNRDNSIIKYFIKFKRNIYYINDKLIYSESQSNNKLKIRKANNTKAIYILINS